MFYFITWLKPGEISVSGIKGKFLNGNEGYMWANGRVRFENNAILSVIDGLGYPDQSGGSYVNELVVEAACLSILNDGDMVRIEYGENPHVKLRR